MTQADFEALGYCTRCRCFTDHSLGETTVLPDPANNDPATAIDVVALMCDVCGASTQREADDA